MISETPEKRGVFGKYIIEKANGNPLDPEATYFVLRLDTDHAARRAMAQYARSCRRENPRLANDIEDCLASLERPSCGCREAHCPHEPRIDGRWYAGPIP